MQTEKLHQKKSKGLLVNTVHQRVCVENLFP